MPVCFQLYPKGSSEPLSLQRVDDLMRVHFQQPPDPDHWLSGWYDSIGLRLALGKSFQQIREEFESYVGGEGGESQWYSTALLMVNYLEERYDTNSWREGR